MFEPPEHEEERDLVSTHSVLLVLQTVLSDVPLVRAARRAAIFLFTQVGQRKVVEMMEIPHTLVGGQWVVPELLD